MLGSLFRLSSKEKKSLSTFTTLFGFFHSGIAPSLSRMPERLRLFTELKIAPNPHIPTKKVPAPKASGCTFLVTFPKAGILLIPWVFNHYFTTKTPAANRAAENFAYPAALYLPSFISLFWLSVRKEWWLYQVTFYPLSPTLLKVNMDFAMIY